MVALDSNGVLRDFYFHYVGLENQMHGGCISRIGVFVDNQFSWLSDPDWRVEVDYSHETLVSNIGAVNEKLQIELNFWDIVYNERNIFMRRVIVKNKISRKRRIGVFFNHQFRMYETPRGDTAYFDPDDNTIVHYKGRRNVVIGGKLGGRSFDDYSVGLFGWGGQEGTWRDSEDGVLAKNPIEHGSVDSTIAFNEDVDSNSSIEIYVWLSASLSLADAKLGHKYILERNPNHLMQSTSDFWKAWVNKSNFDFSNLSNRVIDLFKKSLLITRVHIGNNGSVIASGDSDMLQAGKDTYSYVWMRDASYICFALDIAGYSETTRLFFEFANEVVSADGYFYHKYRPDKSVGSSWHPWISDGIRQLPIQEDETAMVIVSLWNHYQKTLDLEFVEKIYNSLIGKASNFMLGFRDGLTRLPAASYDLWEMKYGISTYTACNVYAALVASSNFAKLLGKNKDHANYEKGAQEIKEGILKYLYNEEKGYFYKLIDVKNGKILHDETIDMSSFFGLYRFGVIDVDDPRLLKFFEEIKNKLITNTLISGVVRFEGDKYYRVSDSSPSNPWFITTLWLAQYYLMKAKTEAELEESRKWIEWAVTYSLKSGVLSEQINPYTGEQISASPLAWSHAEFIITVIGYLSKLKDFGGSK
jgi:GH15 family glucan-1,4-alpha-glucosidase